MAVGTVSVCFRVEDINLSLRLGALLCARIGLSAKRSFPFSLTCRISQCFRIEFMIGGFMGLKVSMRGVFGGDVLVGLLVSNDFLSTSSARLRWVSITFVGYPRLV